MRTTLGNQLSGAYIHGSLATGSFNPRTSDIDLLITTRRLTDGPTNDLLRDEYEGILGRDAERRANCSTPPSCRPRGSGSRGSRPATSRRCDLTKGLSSDRSGRSL